MLRRPGILKKLRRHIIVATSFVMRHSWTTLQRAATQPALTLSRKLSYKSERCARKWYTCFYGFYLGDSMRIWRVHSMAVNEHISLLMECMARASTCYPGGPPWPTSDKRSPAELWYYVSVGFTDFVRRHNPCQVGVHRASGRPCHLKSPFVFSFCSRLFYR